MARYRYDNLSHTKKCFRETSHGLLNHHILIFDLYGEEHVLVKKYFPTFALNCPFDPISFRSFLLCDVDANVTLMQHLQTFKTAYATSLNKA